MPIPALIAAGVAGIGGGIAQAVGGHEAAGKQRTAAEEQLARIEAIKRLGFDPKQFNPETFDPTRYGVQQEYNYNQVQDSPEARQYMLQALQQMKGNADQSIGSQNELDRYNATSDASRMAASRDAATAQMMARRGQQTPGLELVMRQRASQDASGNARADSMRAAASAALQRLQANNAQFGAASNLRGQDVDLSARNTDIINSFNARNTDLRNWRNNANTDMGNNAGAANANIRNTAQQYNMDRGDRNAMNVFNADMAKVGAGNQAIGARGNAEAAQINAIGSGIANGLGSVGQLVGMGAAGGAFGGGGGAASAPTFGGAAGSALQSPDPRFQLQSYWGQR